ncbi:MAG: hypothetical protein ACKPKO_44185, partial [Candidatus Fonsibacter sp.]
FFFSKLASWKCFKVSGFYFDVSVVKLALSRFSTIFVEIPKNKNLKENDQHFPCFSIICLVHVNRFFTTTLEL